MKSFSDVLPELQPLLASCQPWNPDVPQVFPVRQPAEDILRREVFISTPDGDRRGKVYRPRCHADRCLPAMLWCHGGGYVAGDIEADAPLCEQFAREADCVVVTVEYRLAPRFPYPAGLNDCYAALVWMAAQADSLGIDSRRIAVSGASAGGGMAAALALLCRDRGTPKLCFQQPLYPMLDDRNCTPSSKEITDENFPLAWNRKHNLYAWDCYLKDLRAVHADIPVYAAPTRADDLHGLPPAYLCVGTLDMFRDEVLDYVTRLAQADVPVEFHLYNGGFHGFESVYLPSHIGEECRHAYIEAMRRALHAPSEKI